MARSVSATLEAAQYAASRTAYIHMVFTSYDGLTTYDLSTDGDYGNRFLLIDHNEESYNDYAVIVLRNYDRMLPSNLTGYWTEIGYGDVTGGGNEYIGDGTSEGPTPRLWVKHHQEVNAGGKLLTILELEGQWSKMRETDIRLGSPPFYNATYTDQVVFDLIDLVLAELDPAMALETLVEDDGIIDDYQPAFSVNETELFENAGSLVYRLIRMTKSYLRPKPSLKFEVKFPQDADSADLTYYRSKSPYFIEYTERRNLHVPNHIYLMANAGDDGLWTDIIVAEAEDTVSTGRYGDVPKVALAPSITNETDAENRAAAILARTRAEAQAGILVIPHDCQMELYDKLSILV